jgi:hypothetical protein
VYYLVHRREALAKKKNRTPKEKAETRGATRKTAIRKMRAAAKAKPKVKAQKATKAKTPGQSLSKSVAGMNRAEGLRLFKVAGRPTKEQVILVFGERGPRMTWDERAKAGVSAQHFQATLEAKLVEKGVSRPRTAKPARTIRQTATLPLAGA